jgi:hypothetical protein
MRFWRMMCLGMLDGMSLWTPLLLNFTGSANLTLRRQMLARLGPDSKRKDNVCTTVRKITYLFQVTPHCWAYILGCTGKVPPRHPTQSLRLGAPLPIAPVERMQNGSAILAITIKRSHALNCPTKKCSGNLPWRPMYPVVRGQSPTAGNSTTPVPRLTRSSCIVDC